MSPVYLALLLLASAGLTIVITMAHIGAPLRRLFPPPVGSRSVPEGEHRPALLTCPLCTGFWIGLGTGLYARTSFPRPGDIIAFAFAAALVSYLVGIWIAKNDP